MSAVQIIVGGSPGGTISVKPVNDAATQSISYSIRRPAGLASADLVQTIHATFGSPASDTSRYEVTITSATGEVAPTTVSRPTIDPGMAVLVFLLR